MYSILGVLYLVFKISCDIIQGSSMKQQDYLIPLDSDPTFKTFIGFVKFHRFIGSMLTTLKNNKLKLLTFLKFGP